MANGDVVRSRPVTSLDRRSEVGVFAPRLTDARFQSLGVDPTNDVGQLADHRRQQGVVRHCRQVFVELGVELGEVTEVTVDNGRRAIGDDLSELS